VPSPLVSRLANALLRVLDAFVRDELEAVLVDELELAPSADSTSDRLSEPLEPNWLIRSEARVLAAASIPELEESSPVWLEVRADKVSGLKRSDPPLPPVGGGPLGGGPGGGP
jgi:hypothetical protein